MTPAQVKQLLDSIRLVTDEITAIRLELQRLNDDGVTVWAGSTMEEN